MTRAMAAQWEKESHWMRFKSYTNFTLLNHSAMKESIFLSRVEGRGFQVEGEGSMSRVEGNLFFSQFFFSEKVTIDALKK